MSHPTVDLRRLSSCFHQPNSLSASLSIVPGSKTPEVKIYLYFILNIRVHRPYDLLNSFVPILYPVFNFVQ